MKHLKVFTSPTCQPCQTLKPLLTDLGITIVEVDIQAQPAIAAMHSVRSVPTLKLYDDANLVRTHVGAISQQTLHSFIG